MNWNNNEECLEAVKEDGLNLEFVVKQNARICAEAVTQNGNALYYVKRQTPKLCKLACKENGNALYYVKKQTVEIVAQAIVSHEYADEYMEIPWSVELEREMVMLSI